MPTLDIIRQALQVTPKLRKMCFDPYSSSPVDFLATLPPMEYICPYKSPQAWVVFRIFRLISRIPGSIRSLYYLCRREYIPYDQSRQLPEGSEWAFNGTMGALTDWSNVDLEVIRRGKNDLAISFYDLNALRWLVTDLRDGPIMVPHLQKILEPMALHLIMPAVLDQWFFLPNREWSTKDISEAIRSPK
ncbi:hypothetical protein PQX77_003512 [Marasmius sp. AFHP31]|nr:hypothetical protein PQX77_003512 [Marasmius sp. AFHP31]